ISSIDTTKRKNTSLIGKSNNALIVKATVIRRMYARKNQNAGSALRSMKQSSAKAKQYNVQTVMAHTIGLEVSLLSKTRGLAGSTDITCGQGSDDLVPRVIGKLG